MSKITAFMCCDATDKIQVIYSKMAMKRVEEFDQKILLADKCSPEVIDYAHENDWEVWLWDGPDSMSERRNYAIGFTGNEDYTPKWVGEVELHPKVKNDWILQVDHDEIFQAENIKDVLDSIKDKPELQQECAGIFRIHNVAPEPDGTKRIQTTAPVIRLFQKDNIYWKYDAQNEAVWEGPAFNLKDGSNNELIIDHWGYADPDYHTMKQWKRMPALEERVLGEPENTYHRMYLICAISQTGGGNILGWERLRGHVHVVVDLFLSDKSFYRNRHDQTNLARIIRHFWGPADQFGMYDEFSRVLDKVEKHIDFVPDVPFWRFLMAVNTQDTDGVIKHGPRFLKTMEKFQTDSARMNVELYSGGKEKGVIQDVEMALFAKANMTIGEESRKYYREFMKWSKKR